MDRRRFALSAVGVAVVSGCGGGGGAGGVFFPPIGTAPAPPGASPEAPAAPAAPAPDAAVPHPPAVNPPVPAPPAPPAAPELATPTSLPASTTFAQCIAQRDNGRSVGPGQANFWDLNPYFGIQSGANDQFAGAMSLSVKVGTRSAGFDGDQTFAELTALGPEMTAADGLKLVSITTDAAFQANGDTAFLHAVPNARLQQTLDLTLATGRVNAGWNGMYGSTLLRNFNDEEAFMQVVLRDTGGNLLSTLYRVDSNGAVGTWGFAWITAYTGRVVVLSFEQSGRGVGTSIDDVTVSDFAPRPKEFIVNGDFSAGLAGWTVSQARVAQNIRSGMRTLRGLQVQRTFYAQPDQQWARLTDTFHNPGASSVTAVATYTSFLGSNGAGVVYPTPGAPQKGLTVWDGMGVGRDAGLVFGSAAAVDFTSASALNTSDGSNRVDIRFNVTVPAGGTVTLANFVILTGAKTWIGATGTTARATDVDTQAAAIAAGFRTDVVYQRGLTQVQLDTLQNF